ncbi:hypothetical protein KKG90_03195 [Candidatus Bipolaricaulota bacterium]|nr:hypothetical protein [Candidatus Bipolaricaulota bacterium]
MGVAIPNERVYYYECSSGRFRLTYFIPRGELEQLCEGSRIDAKVLEDFPDGVDLGCTEADFGDFKRMYGYCPRQDPEALRSAFLAILSATRNWKSFRGSGFIPATDLERHVEAVDEILFDSLPRQIEMEPPGLPSSLQQRRRTRHRQAVRHLKADKTLRDLQVEGIDPKRTLSQQTFSRITTDAGAGAEEVFVRLHHKQRKRK